MFRYNKYFLSQYKLPNFIFLSSVHASMAHNKNPVLKLQCIKDPHSEPPTPIDGGMGWNQHFWSFYLFVKKLILYFVSSSLCKCMLLPPKVEDIQHLQTRPFSHKYALSFIFAINLPWRNFFRLLSWPFFYSPHCFTNYS